MVDLMEKMQGTGSYNKFLTPAGALKRFLSAWARKNKFFDNVTGEYVGSGSYKQIADELKSK